MTFENLETVFKKSNKPYWYLFKGNTRGTVLASAFFEDEEPDNAKSWDQLAEIMREFDDGTYSVELRTTPNSSRNNPFITFQMGDAPRASGSAQATAVAGAEPRGFMNGLSMQYFLEQNRRDWTEIQDLKMEVLKKDFELRQLKTEQDQKEQPDLIGRVFGLVEKNPHILLRLLGDGPEAKAAIGVLKAEKPIGTTAKPADDQDEEEEYEDEPPGNISIDRAVNCLVRLQKVFPDRNVNQLLEDLTDFCEEDPEKAAQILDYL